MIEGETDLLTVIETKEDIPKKCNDKFLVYVLMTQKPVEHVILL